MVRKLAAVLLLSFLIVAFVATSVSFGADKPLKPLKDRASIPARLAPVYSFPDLTGDGYTAPAPPPEKRVLRGAKSGEGIIETIGSTTYCYQHNCTLGRQVEHRRGFTNPYNQYGYHVHFDWMSKPNDTLGQNRGIGYQAYEITACDHVFTPGGIRIEAARAGYVNLDVHTIDAMNSWGIPMAHQNEDEWYAKAFWDFTLGGPVFGVFTSDGNITDHYGHWQNNGTGPGNQNIWPKGDWDVDGQEYILHMVTTETGGAAGDPQTHSYYRRVGPYGTGSGVWSDQRLIDTVMNINVTCVSSPVSDKVAIVWNSTVDYLRDTPDDFPNQLENDVWFAISTDNGAGWENPAGGGSPGPSIGHDVDLGVGGGYIASVGGNLTTYAPTSDYKAYCDMAALWYIDELQDDWLQIVWGCRRWTDTTSLYRRQGAIFHWNQKTDVIRTVVKADWDTGGACYGHVWSTDVAKMTISQCDGKMYICYSQFGDATHPCHYYDADNNVVAGRIFVTVFEPTYDAWDRPQQVTTVANTTPCVPGDMSGPGDCNSENWSSMARYGRTDTCKVETPTEVLDILYINDYAPGGCVQTESGVWTVNPVNWAVYPCRDAVPEPGYSDDAGPGYGLCVGEPILVIGTTDDTTFTLTLENFGILDNQFTISAAVTGSNGPSNGANTTIELDIGGGTIPGKGGTLPVQVTITTSGEDDLSTVEGNIEVIHEAEGSPRNIPMCITVSDDYNPLESATLATTCKRLRVYNNGEMSNNGANMSLDYSDDADDCATVYLFDASPVVCRVDGEGTRRCYFTVYDNDYGSDHAMRQVSAMYYDNTSNTDYEYATAEFITGDSAISMVVEYFAPKAEENCEFIIQKLKFWNRTGSILDSVAVGEALDWDVPSFEHGSNNESDYDATRKLIYQFCNCPTQGYRDDCDTLLTCNRYAGIASYGAETDFKNYMTLENDVYVYTSGPFGNEAPMPDDTIYGLMKGNDGFSTATLDSCEDLFTLVTFDVYDLEPDSVMCVVKILVSSKYDDGGNNLKAAVDAANDFIAAHDEIKCVDFVCDCLPGDANGDGQVNVGDAVYVIGYVFKGGPAPTPYAKCSGDANGDCQCNVGDAVYIIGYVFKGGPPPVTCEAWIAACGVPIQ